ncbi:MAG TPA: hypothetical protein VKC34_13695 [Blastocatellia bacterium]|nr:hypothetical protein [Blastocatellia bacterium]
MASADANLMIEKQVEFNKPVESGETQARPARRTLARRTRVRLTNLLIGKAIAEAALVAALALLFYFTTFPPYYRGWGEATQQGIQGWAVNNASPWDRVEVQLYIDGRFVAAQTANLSRPDVSSAGYAKDEWHGYAFGLPPLERGEHEASVYALHRSKEGTRYTLQLLGKPIRFRVDAGTVVPLSNSNMN